MRQTLNYDNSKNKYITKLQKLYSINPYAFYKIINTLFKHKRPVGELYFSHKTECVHLPTKGKIYPATIWHPYYEIYVLDNQKELLDPEYIKKHISLITDTDQFPHILVITNAKNHQKIQQQIEQYLPKQTDDIHYTIAIITSDEFNNTYADIMNNAIKDTLNKIQRVI
ncbi:MAG: hypothetical protein MJ164_04125 [Alphaproteobacteria bacterium]|nr:hypothetical protein [Alphaproteobacteria bacterium]